MDKRRGRDQLKSMYAQPVDTDSTVVKAQRGGDPEEMGKVGWGGADRDICNSVNHNKVFKNLSRKRLG